MKSVARDCHVIPFGDDGFGLCRCGAGSACESGRSTLGPAGGYLHWLFGWSWRGCRAEVLGLVHS